MTLSAGARLWPYEIFGLIGGVGGMGEVYRALGPRLDVRVSKAVSLGDKGNIPLSAWTHKAGRRSARWRPLSCHVDRDIAKLASWQLTR